MQTEIWYEYVDDDTPSLIFKSNSIVVDTEAIIIPAIGEKVGWREAPIGAPHYCLDYVVDVRHYVTKVPHREGSTYMIWQQEIHIMCSSKK